MNFFEGIPYAEAGVGKRKLVDEKNLSIMQVALKTGQKVPPHEANSNVHIIVVEGEVIITLSGEEIPLKKGTLLPVVYKTPMRIKNDSGADAFFLVLKTPNPSTTT